MISMKTMRVETLRGCKILLMKIGGRGLVRALLLWGFGGSGGEDDGYDDVIWLG